MQPWSFHARSPGVRTLLGMMPGRSAGALLMAAPRSREMLHPQLLPPVPSVHREEEFGIKKRKKKKTKTKQRKAEA